MRKDIKTQFMAPSRNETFKTQFNIYKHKISNS